MRTLVEHLRNVAFWVAIMETPDEPVAGEEPPTEQMKAVFSAGLEGIEILFRVAVGALSSERRVELAKKIRAAAANNDEILRPELERYAVIVETGGAW